jgi:hypothetical protein
MEADYTDGQRSATRKSSAQVNQLLHFGQFWFNLAEQ